MMIFASPLFCGCARIGYFNPSSLSVGELRSTDRGIAIVRREPAPMQ
jgi:hypothetical protein